MIRERYINVWFWLNIIMVVVNMMLFFINFSLGKHQESKDNMLTCLVSFLGAAVWYYMGKQEKNEEKE